MIAKIGQEIVDEREDEKGVRRDQGTEEHGRPWRFVDLCHVRRSFNGADSERFLHTQLDVDLLYHSIADVRNMRQEEEE